MTEETAKQLVYVADPMCSWCWGFTPVLEGLLDTVGDAASVHVLMGGLRPGTLALMDEAARNEVRSHWEHVREASGQPFDFGFFDRAAFVYDTEPACRAVVAVRRIDPGRARGFLAALHQAFYAENRDITDPETLVEAAGAFGYEPGGFREIFLAPETRQATAMDFDTARRLGINGFPTLLAREGQRAAPLTKGYQPIEQLRPMLQAWLSGEAHIGQDGRG